MFPYGSLNLIPPCLIRIEVEICRGVFDMRERREAEISKDFFSSQYPFPGRTLACQKSKVTEIFSVAREISAIRTEYDYTENADAIFFAFV